MRLSTAVQPIDKLTEKDATGWFVNNRDLPVLIYTWLLTSHAAKRPVVTRLEPLGRYHVRGDQAMKHQLVWVTPKLPEPGTP